MFPDAPIPHLNLANAYEAKGMYSEAFEQVQTFTKLNGTSPENIKDCQLAFEKGGYKGFAQKLLEIQLNRQKSILEKDKNAYLPALL